MRPLRLIASILVACAVVVGLAHVSFEALRSAWPEYAAAEPTKAFTLGMLFARLGIAALLAVSAAAAATLVAGETLAAWIVGGLFVLLSLPSHLYYVWDDYPVWYHFVYLLSLVPLAGLCGVGLRAALPGAVRA